MSSILSVAGLDSAPRTHTEEESRSISPQSHEDNKNDDVSTESKDSAPLAFETKEKEGKIFLSLFSYVYSSFYSFMI